MLNLQTSGFVEPGELYFTLAADWVELVGKRGKDYVYRFSSPAGLQDMGDHLYKINRMRTVGRQKKGRLLNTYTALRTDMGLQVWVKASQTPPHTSPCIQRIRFETDVRQAMKNRRIGEWFSIRVGMATREVLWDWIHTLNLHPKKQGITWDNGATLWVYVEDDEEVQKLKRNTIIRVKGTAGHWPIRRVQRAPINLEPKWKLTQHWRMPKKLRTGSSPKSAERNTWLFKPCTGTEEPS